MANSRAPKDWKRRESLGSALAQIALVAVMLALTVYVVYRRGTARRDLAEVMREARVKALNGNRAELRAALGLLEGALKLDPDAADPNALGAALWIDLFLEHGEPGAKAKATELFDRAKKAGAHGDERFGVEAQLRLEAGDPAGVVSFVEGLRKQGGSGARLFLAQAQALKTQGNLPLARAAFVAAMDKAYRDGRYACALGDELLEEGAIGAIDTFSRVALEHPGLVRAQLGLALAKLLKGERLADVEERLKDTLTHEATLSPPQHARALAINAGLLEAQGHYAEALTEANLALSVEPKEVWAMLFRARALAATAAPGARDAFTALIDASPASPLFYFEGAARLLRAGQSDAAMALLDRYESFFMGVKSPTVDGKEISFLDRDDRYWLARGDLLKSAGRLDDALSAYEKAIDAKGANLTKAVLAKASLLLAQGKIDPAGERLADITPPDGTGLPEAYLAMGEVQFAKKEWGPGCQSFAFGLTRLRDSHTPLTRLNEIYLDVDRRLKAAGQRELARLWMEEARPLVR